MARSSELITNLDRVSPGDLITASFFNSLIEAIWELEDRIVTLEAEGTTEPSSPPTPGAGGVVTEAFRIDFASMELRGTKVMFEVSGSGLAPAGLASKFFFDDKPFSPLQLAGDSDSLTFNTTLAALQPSGGRSPFDNVLNAGGDLSRDKSSGRAAVNHVLGIKNRKNALAQKRIVVTDGGDKL